MANGNLFYNETLSILYGTVSFKEINIDLIMAMPMNVKFPKPTWKIIVIIIIIIIIIIIMLRLETSECVSQ